MEPSSSCVTVLGAGCVVDALLGEAVLGRSRKLLVGRLRVASGLGVGLSLGHEAIERSSHQLLVVALALIGSRGTPEGDSRQQERYQDTFHVGSP